VFDFELTQSPPTHGRHPRAWPAGRALASASSSQGGATPLQVYLLRPASQP